MDNPFCSACGGTGLHGFGGYDGLADLIPRNEAGELVMGPFTVEEWGSLANVILGAVAVYALFVRGR